MPLTFCEKCHVQAECLPLISSLGPVLLCPACYKRRFVPACSPQPHAWQGWATGWICLVCGAGLRHQPITPPAAGLVSDRGNF